MPADVDTEDTVPVATVCAIRQKALHIFAWQEIDAMDNGVGQERLSKDDKLRCSAVILSAAEVYPYFARIANT